MYRQVTMYSLHEYLDCKFVLNIVTVHGAPIRRMGLLNYITSRVNLPIVFRKHECRSIGTTGR